MGLGIRAQPRRCRFTTRTNPSSSSTASSIGVVSSCSSKINDRSINHPSLEPRRNAGLLRVLLASSLLRIAQVRIDAWQQEVHLIPILRLQTEGSELGVVHTVASRDHLMTTEVARPLERKRPERRSPAKEGHAQWNGLLNISNCVDQAKRIWMSEVDEVLVEHFVSAVMTSKFPERTSPVLFFFHGVPWLLGNGFEIGLAQRVLFDGLNERFEDALNLMEWRQGHHLLWVWPCQQHHRGALPCFSPVFDHTDGTGPQNRAISEVLANRSFHSGWSIKS